MEYLSSAEIKKIDIIYCKLLYVIQLNVYII